MNARGAWPRIVAKIAKPTGSKLVKGAAESGDLFGGSRRKIAKKIADHRVMRSSDGEGRSIRSDALYPALSGEWEVPVTRNAKITPVNEGVGSGVGGPPLRDHLWQGPPLPVTLRLIHPPA